MKTLLTLKAFLPLEEAAKYLSITFDDEISATDLLEAAQEGMLQLSINFKQSVPLKPAQLNTPTKTDIERMKHFFADKTFITPDLKSFSEQSDHLIYLHGIFDIPLLANSTVKNQILEFKLNKISSPHPISEKPFKFIVSRDGELFSVVSRYRNISEDGVEYIEPDDFEDDRKFIRKYFGDPFDLPEDSTIGLTRSNIDSFINLILEKHNLKSISPQRAANAKVNKSLLVIIASLLGDSGISLESLSEPSARNSAAEKILRKIELIGCKMNIDTIKDKLSQIEQAIESREV